jgi:hypothetical protein
MKKNYTKLILGIIFDLIGYSSFFFPPIDFVWAPLSSFIMLKMYKGNKGKYAAIFSFVEEILPFTDVIPTFTIMWFYTNYSKKKTEEI